MAVVAGTGVVLVDNFLESHQELRQLRRLDRAIFDKSNGLAFAFHSQQEAEARLAKFPDPRLLSRIEGADVRIAEFLAFQRGFEGLDFRAKLRFAVSVKLDEQNGRRLPIEEIH